MGNVRMRAEQINYGASNVKVALDDLDPQELIALSARMDTIEAWKATVKAEEITGASVEYTNALALPALSVSAEIEAIQDLHGYDKPWVGGAGKSKVDFGLTDASGGLTVTTTNNVISISGTCSASPYIKGIGESTISPNTYKLIISGENCPAFRLNYVLKKNGSTVYTSSDDWVYTDQQAYNATLNLSSYDFDTISFSVKISNGVQFTNTKLYPMLCLATETDTSFVPYENICPITGFSSVTITDVDSESHTATVTVSLGSTVYGGSLDLTSGELTITHANIASYNGETIGEPWISSMDEYTQGGTPTTGAQVVYTLAAPTTTTLTAAQLEMVKGYNRISANSGDITVKAYTGAPWGGDTI